MAINSLSSYSCFVEYNCFKNRRFSYNPSVTRDSFQVPVCSDHWQFLLGWTVDTQRCLQLTCIILELKRNSPDHFVLFFLLLGWWECEYHLLSEPVPLGKVISWPQNTLLWCGAISFLCPNTEWCQGLPPCWLLF